MVLIIRRGWAGGIEISNCEFFTDRRSLSHTKTKVQTGGTPEICKQAETYAVSAIFLSKAGEKDGTRRGGRRVRAGDKPKALSDKIAEGKDADIMEFHAPELDAADLDDAADLTGADMPSPSAYLSAQQKNGKPLGADIVYKETWLWLKQRGCEKHVNKRLLESYSQAFARFVQCEEALGTYGLLGKHPTTGGVIASPFVQMSQTFQKQANLLWYEIFDIVKQNCTTKFDGTPQDDLMEQLLSSRK